MSVCLSVCHDSQAVYFVCVPVGEGGVGGEVGGRRSGGRFIYIKDKIHTYQLYKTNTPMTQNICIRQNTRKINNADNTSESPARDRLTKFSKTKMQANKTRENHDSGNGVISSLCQPLLFSANRLRMYLWSTLCTLCLLACQ